MLQPFEAATVLRDRHFVELKPRGLKLLAGVELGLFSEEIASHLAVPTPSVRRQISRIEALIFDPLQLDHRRPRLAKWTRDHFPCCTHQGIPLVTACAPWRSRLDQIRRACRPGISRRRLQLLAANEMGYSHIEIGEGLCLAPSSVNGALGALQREILGGLGFAPSRTLLGKWTHEHAACCTQGCRYMFQTDQIFDHRDRPLRIPHG